MVLAVNYGAVALDIMRLIKHEATLLHFTKPYFQPNRDSLHHSIFWLPFQLTRLSGLPINDIEDRNGKIYVCDHIKGHIPLLVYTIHINPVNSIFGCPNFL